MSYRNPEIIVDNSGTMVSEALTRGLADISSAFVERKKRAIEAGKIDTARLNEQSKQNADFQAGLAKTGKKSGQSQEVVKNFTDASTAWMEYKNKLSNELAGGVTNERRKEIESKLVIIPGKIDQLNDYIGSVATAAQDQKDLMNDPTVMNKSINWGSGVNGSTNTTRGLSAATSGLGDNTFNLEMVYDANGDPTDTIFKGSGGGDDESDKWEVNMGLTEANALLNNLTHDVTPIIDNGNQRMSENIFDKDGDVKGVFTEGMEQGNAFEVKVTANDNPNGVPTQTTTSLFALNENGNKAMRELGMYGWSEFISGERQDQISMLTHQLGYTPEDAQKMMNDLGSAEKATELQKEFEQDYIKTILSAQGSPITERNGKFYKVKIESKPVPTGADGDFAKYNNDILQNVSEKTSQTLVPSDFGVGPNSRIFEGSGWKTINDIEIVDGIATVKLGGKNPPPIPPYDLNTKDGVMSFIQNTSSASAGTNKVLAQNIWDKLNSNQQK